MKKNYNKPELNISEYIIEETITASSFNQVFVQNAATDTQVGWEDFVA